jgi:multidrug resistance protein, MATE family
MSTPTPTAADPSQRPSRTLRDELGQLLRLGLPIVFVQLGMTAMNFVDVALLGQHDPASLPAMSLGNTLSWAAMVFCMGVVTVIDPLLSQAVGARDEAAIPRLLGRGLLLSLVLSVPAALLLLPATTWLELAGQPARLIPEAGTYARLQAFAVLPFLAYAVLRSLLSARARLWPQVVTILVGNAANALLDWIFVFGKFGAPELGATGAAISTVVCRWLMVLALLYLGRRDIVPPLRALAEATVRRRVLELAPLWRLLRLGAPIGAQFALEMGVFAATGLLIGHFDALAGGGGGHGEHLAGHQIALQLASLTFMVPLGLGIAASVRVGWAVGRGDPAAMRRAAGAALLAGAAVMTLFMLVFLTMPGPLAGLLTRHEPAALVAIALIPIAGVFQIGDGIQVVAIGCLRGLGDVRSPVAANVVGFWLIGLPLGAWLTFGRGAGPAGLWWGLVSGLFLVAIALLFVLRLRLGEQRPRLYFD